MSEPIVQATLSESGTLIVRYEGRVESETVQISPVPVPAPGAKTLALRWDDVNGLVLYGAITDQFGTRLSFSDQRGLLHLIASVKEHGPITLVLLSNDRPTDEQRGTLTAALTPNRAVDRPSRADLSVLTDARPGAFLIVAAQHWAPTRSLPSQPPLSRPQIDAFADESPKARYVAETVARSWGEYVRAGGTAPAQFETLAETLLVQWDRKNPSAVPGYLRVDARPEGWGLYRNEIRWYDENGLPVIGPAGIYWDHSYAPLMRPDWALRLVVDDPELFTLMTFYQQATAVGSLDAAAAAQGYFQNVDLLVPAVLKNWPFLDQLTDEIVEMLPLVVAFLGVELVSRVYILTQDPTLMTIGYTLLALAKGAGWVLQMTFFGSIAIHASAAGRELLLVRRSPNGTLDQLSQRHFAKAVVLVRQVVVDIATIRLAKALATNGPAVARGLAVAGKAVADKARLPIRTDLAPALAGAYGTGSPLDVVAMSTPAPEELGPGHSEASGKSAGPAPKAKADFRPENWRELEKKVVDEFHRSVSENGPTYYTSLRHQVRVIWREFSAFAKQLRASGNPDPIPAANPDILELTRQQLVNGNPELRDECAATSRWLKARLEMAERRVQAAGGDRVSRRAAELERAKWSDALSRWFLWLQTKVGDQMLDLFELNPATRQAAVIDASFAWADRLHNLKSRVYLESLNRLLGWQGGSALDVGNGMFQSRIFLGTPDSPPPTPTPTAQ